MPTHPLLCAVQHIHPRPADKCKGHRDDCVDRNHGRPRRAVALTRLMRPLHSTALLLATLLLGPTACHPAGDRAAMPGDSADTSPFSAIQPDDRLHFTGTEPFWGGEVAGGTLTYRTVDYPEGQSISVSRFAGRGGLSFSGRLDTAPLDLTITDGACSDGMSDRRYPFTATLRIGSDVRNGCAWSDAHPATDERAGA